MSAETKARWELLRALVGAEDKISQSVKRQEPSSDNEDYRPSVKLRRSLARRGRRPLSASSSHGMRPLLLPQKVLNDRAASPTRSEDPLPALPSETLEAIRSKMPVLSREGTHLASSEHEQGQKSEVEGRRSSQLEIEVDHSFLSPISLSMKSNGPQNIVSPNQEQSGPRQSPSSYTAQQRSPIPHQDIPLQLLSDQSSPVGGMSGYSPSGSFESQSLDQPMSISDTGKNNTPQSQNLPPRHLVTPQQNLGSKDQAFSPTSRIPTNPPISQSLDPQRPVPQIDFQRLPSHEIRPAPIPATSSQPIFSIPGEQGQGMPPRPQTQHHPAPAPPGLQPGLPPNVQQRSMPSSQQPVIPTQQWLSLPFQQQSVLNPLQARNSSSPQQLPPAGSRPPNPVNAQRLPTSPPPNRTPSSQSPPNFGRPTHAAPQVRTPQPSIQHLPSQHPSAVPQIQVRATPPPLPPRSSDQQPSSQNQSTSRPPQLQQTPPPYQPSQQRLDNKFSQQTPLPPQNVTPPQTRPSSQSAPPSQRPLSNLPSSQKQAPQVRNVTSQQNPHKLSPKFPATPPQTTLPHSTLEARQLPSAPQQRPLEPQFSQAANSQLHPTPPPKSPLASRATPPLNPNPQTRSPLQNPITQHSLAQTVSPQVGDLQQIKPATSSSPFQSHTQHPSQRANQPSTPAATPTNLVDPAIPMPNTPGKLHQNRPSMLAINQSSQQPQMTSQRPSQANIPPTPFTQPQSNTTPKPGQTPPKSLGLTRNPPIQPVTDRPQPDLANRPTGTLGQSRFSAQDPTNTTLDRGETQTRPPLPRTPPQLQQQNRDSHTPIPANISSQDPRRPKIPARSESEPPFSLQPAINREKATIPDPLHDPQSDESKSLPRTGPSVLSRQRNPSQYERNNLDPKQERKPNRKLSMEEVLVLWLHGELPDDFLSTESGKKMIPESGSIALFLPGHLSGDLVPELYTPIANTLSCVQCSFTGWHLWGKCFWKRPKSRREGVGEKGSVDVFGCVGNNAALPHRVVISGK